MREYAAELDFEIHRVPIDNDAELEQAYGAKVPVLVRGGEEVCHYFLDTRALKQALN